MLTFLSDWLSKLYYFDEKNCTKELKKVWRIQKKGISLRPLWKRTGHAFNV